MALDRPGTFTSRGAPWGNSSTLPPSAFRLSSLPARFAAAVVLTLAVANVEVSVRRRVVAGHAALATRAVRADDLRERRSRLRLETGRAAADAADAPRGRGLLDRAAEPDAPAAAPAPPLLWWRR